MYGDWNPDGGISHLGVPPLVHECVSALVYFQFFGYIMFRLPPFVHEYMLWFLLLGFIRITARSIEYAPGLHQGSISSPID